MRWFLVVFFFQAEDGIRDHCVTGVQTCALPILFAGQLADIETWDINEVWTGTVAQLGTAFSADWEIGRASCRVRV